MIADKSATNSQLVEPRSRNLQLKIWCKLWQIMAIETRNNKKDQEIKQEHGGL